MKIKETQVDVYTGQSNDRWNTPIYKQYTKRKNTDGKEILSWMRNMAKIDAFGLKEIPIFKGNALGRFMDMDSIHKGSVIMYVVREVGLYRIFIDVNSKYFTNNGSASEIGALSEASLIKNILKYKEGKRVIEKEKVYLRSFRRRMLRMIENGGVMPKLTPIQRLFKSIDINLPSNIKNLSQLNNFISENLDLGMVPQYPQHDDPYFNQRQTIEHPVTFDKTF